MNDPQLLTVEELAARLRVKPSWVYSHADDLGVLRLGKYLRFNWQRVLECLTADVHPNLDVGSATQRPHPRD